MKMRARRAWVLLAMGGALAWSAAARAEQATPGVTDASVRIGQTVPYSGPLSTFGTHGRASAAYFRMINEKGGVNGRKIELISLDDSFSPPKAVEQVRRLVEQDDVFVLFSPFGTPTNAATQKYINAKEVPALFVASGAGRFYDPERFPWTLAFVPNTKSEATVYGKYISNNVSDPKIGILYQNDDFGRDFIAGLKQGLGPAADKLIVKQVSYEPTDATVDSQVILLRSSGANVLVNVAGPKFAAQIIKKVAEIGWKPVHIVSSSGSSIAGVLIPAGPENALGVISARYLKDPSDPRWTDDAGMKAYIDFMKTYYPEGDVNDISNVLAVTLADLFVRVLEKSGPELTRKGIMKVATSIHDVELPLLLPGIKINTGPSDYRPVEQQQLVRFNGKAWELFGDLIGE